MASGDPDLQSHLKYRRILLQLGRLEHVKARECLGRWHEPLGDPIWAVRKAALMAEFGESDGNRHVEAALSAIQDVLPRGPVAEASDFCILSREGWAMVNVASIWSWSEKPYITFATRFEDLASIRSDPYTNLERLESILDVSGSHGRSRRKPFGGLTNGEYALQAYRMIEVGGRIVQLGNNWIGGGLLGAALPWIASDSPSFAIPILLRLCDDRTAERLLGAKTVARFSEEELTETAAICRRALAEAASRLHRTSEPTPVPMSPQDIAIGRVKDQATTALACLRAFVPRLTADGLDDVVRDCAQVRRRWAGGAWQVWEALGATIRSALLAMEATRASTHILDLIDQRLLGADLDLPASLGWDSDPILGLWHAAAPDRSQQADRWTDAVARLLQQIETTANPSTRANGLIRCVVLHRVGTLSAHETNRLTQALWGNETRPAILGMFPLPLRFLLSLPEAQPGAAANLFKRAISQQQLPRFSLGVINGMQRWQMHQSYGDLLTDVLSVTRVPWRDGSRTGLPSIDWTSEDVDALLTKIEIWWADEGLALFQHLREPSPLPGPDWRFLTIVEVLAYVVLPNDRRHIPRAATLLRSLADAGVEVALASPLLAVEDPARAMDVARSLRSAMVSRDLAQATAAMGGAFLWFQDAGRALPASPLDFVRGIGTAIRVRCQPALATALVFAGLIVRSHRETVTAAFLEDIQIGLRHILEETASERSYNEIEPNYGETTIRAAAIDLVVEYANLAEPQDETVLAWFEGAERERANIDRAKLVAAKTRWTERHSLRT